MMHEKQLESAVRIARSVSNAESCILKDRFANFVIYFTRSYAYNMEEFFYLSFNSNEVMQMEL
ncbi:hypothetical protein WN55_10593 [Dufourea novaeangliae]|uniref:Uncharacterized protein n=1 Tax=Dufourea novaeangliae TaxID=178035 RepID=A0A154P4C1_DUFNO|nr:hypothetical protein WN55_10593 [Dufourea novaeangliae]